jgi:hypothetical protein
LVMRRWFLALFIAVPSIAWGAWAQFTSYAPPSGGTGGAFVQMHIGGGGLVSKLRIAADGKQVAATDTGGAFARASHSLPWTPVITRASMPSSPADNGPWTLVGACDIAIAESNTNHLYMYYTPAGGSNSYIYSSTDFGAHWARTDSSFPSTVSGAKCQANNQDSSYRLNADYMAVDPQNENVVYVGTPSDGVWYTLNGGTSWAQISTGTIPAGTVVGSIGQGNLISFDPSDGTGNTVVISAYGTGVYRCTSASTSPSCTELSASGMPTLQTRVRVDTSGTIWVVDNAAGNGNGALLRYLGSTWSTQVSETGNRQLSGIAINPTNSGRVYTVNYQGCLIYTINGQAGSPTWNTYANDPNCFYTSDFVVNSTAIPWQGWKHDTATSALEMQFDPSQSNVLYLANGDGIYTTTPPTTNATSFTTWNADQTVGIENLDLQTNGVSLSSGGVFFGALDRPLWILDGHTYPAQYFPDSDRSNVFNPTHFVCANGSTLFGNPSFNLEYSTSGGASGTWNISGTTGLPTGSGTFGAQQGACVIVSSSTWIVLDSSFSYGPYITTNSGSSWSACTFAGGFTAGGGGWEGFAQDGVTAGTVVLLNSGLGSTNGSGAKGVWKSTSGCSFTKVNDGTLPTAFLTLLTVPGVADTYVAIDSAYPPSSPVGGALYLTSPASLTSSSTAVANISTVWDFGYTFGKTKPGSDGYPEFYCICTYNGTFGTWEAENLDSSPSWTQIGDGYPVGSIDSMSFFVGDLNTYGTLYGGFGNSGGFYRTAN